MKVRSQLHRDSFHLQFGRPVRTLATNLACAERLAAVRPPAEGTGRGG